VDWSALKDGSATRNLALQLEIPEAIYIVKYGVTTEHRKSDWYAALRDGL